MGKWDDRNKKEREILSALIADGGFKGWIRAVWKSRTTRNQASFYKRLDELPEDVRRRFERLPAGRTIDVETLVDLGEEIDLEAWRAKKAGRRPTLEEIRKWWAKAGYGDSSFEFYWSHLPASWRRDVEG